MTTDGLELALNNSRAGLAVDKYGQFTAVDTTEHDVWDVGGVWVPPPVAQVHNLKSTLAADTDTSGTGAWMVGVQGVGASYEPLTEYVALNGVNDVPTVNEYLCIHRMWVESAGTGETAAGSITATAAIAATITAKITVGNNQTLMAIYQVPINQQFSCLGYYFNVNKDSGASPRTVTAKLLAKPPGGVFRLQHTLTIDPIILPYFYHPFKSLKKFSAGTIVKVSATADTTGVNVSAGFDAILWFP